MRPVPLSAMALALGLSIGACTCGEDPINVTPDAGQPDAAEPVSECARLTEACGSSKVCCQGVCGASGVCAQASAECKNADEACGDNLDCCLGRCENNVCSSQRCVDTGDGCTSDTSCCTGHCSTTCQAIPGSTGCKVVGQACGGGVQCCSTNCKDSFCAPAYTCRAQSDLCYGNLDCCSNLCSVNDGSAGFCRGESGGCNQDGLPCSNGTTCCTRVCADPGTGATVCLSGSGCRMTGNACIDEQACCGGGTNPNGTVNCVKALASDAYGKCDNGEACNPVGNICGATFPTASGGTFSVNASQNCCDGKKEVCKLDSAGIPRCYGGGSATCPTGYTGVAPCCIDAGQLCQFKDQCCNGAACVPDPNGILRCTTNSCVSLGSPCSTSGTPCCSGECLATVEFGFFCQIPESGTDTCKPTGSGCATSDVCCSAICSTGTCQQPPQCQGRDAVCTVSGDCCSGLACVVPAGSASGTCKDSTCPNAGQACSPASPCCTGLQCLKDGATTPQTCDGTTGCTCRVVIG